MLGSELTSVPYVLCDITSSIGKYLKKNKTCSRMIFILIFAVLDNLFNLLLFLSWGNIIYYLDYSASSYITHTLSAAPGLHYLPSAAIPSFWSTRATLSSQIPTICVPPPSLSSLYWLLMPPIVPCTTPAVTVLLSPLPSDKLLIYRLGIWIIEKNSCSHVLSPLRYFLTG